MLWALCLCLRHWDCVFVHLWLLRGVNSLIFTHLRGRSWVSLSRTHRAPGNQRRPTSRYLGRRCTRCSGAAGSLPRGWLGGGLLRGAPASPGPSQPLRSVGPGRDRQAGPNLLPVSSGWGARPSVLVSHLRRAAVGPLPWSEFFSAPHKELRLPDRGPGPARIGGCSPPTPKTSSSTPRRRRLLFFVAPPF